MTLIFRIMQRLKLTLKLLYNFDEYRKLDY
jgi:hypothetical protein